MIQNLLISFLIIIDVFGVILLLLIPGIKLLRGKTKPSLNQINGSMMVLSTLMWFLFITYWSVQYAFGGPEGFCKAILGIE